MAALAVHAGTEPGGGARWTEPPHFSERRGLSPTFFQRQAGRVKTIVNCIKREERVIVHNGHIMNNGHLMGPRPS